ncbi:Interactor of constitutive active ROPs 3 [Spatholobus suberectus]|nr:Interactor of constitutive active ROPs 3 [Spatholobus suberectus]
MADIDYMAEDQSLKELGWTIHPLNKHTQQEWRSTRHVIKHETDKLTCNSSTFTRLRSGSSEVPQKVSPCAVCRLRPTTLDIDSISSLSQATKSSEERSPKVIDCKSPRSPIIERKRPSKISELESQISQLQIDLKKVRDELILFESCKKQA